MKGRMGLVHGSGNVFRDFKRPNADVEQLKAILAAEIIKTLDREEMTHDQAQVKTGVTASDFSRIRQVKLDRFTVDRLMNVMNRLGNRVEVKVKVKRAGRDGHAAI